MSATVHALPRRREEAHQFDLVEKYRQLQERELRAMIDAERRAAEHKRAWQAYGVRISILTGVGDTIDDGGPDVA